MRETFEISEYFREEGRLLLRRGDGLRLWYAALREAVDRWDVMILVI